PDNYAGVAVFNPSRVLAGGLFHTCTGSQGLRPVDPAELAHEAARAIVDLGNAVWRGPLNRYREQSVQFERQLVKRARRCLRSFCVRHTLPTDEADTAQSLNEH